MSTPTITPVRAAQMPADPDLPTPSGLAAAPKLRRRPFVLGASIAAVCFGALVGVMAFNAVSSAHDVVVVRQTVERGSVIDREDLMTVRIGVDPAVKAIPGAQLESLVGQRAALDLAAGGVVTPEQVTSAPLPSSGSSIVGVSLTPAMLPAKQLRTGDLVRVVTTPGQQGDVAANPETVEAVVVGIAAESTTGNTILNVQVPHAVAPRVAAVAASGKVAVVLDSQER